MNAWLGNKLCLLSPPEDLARRIRNDLTIENPAFLEAERAGRWTGQIQRYLRYFDGDETSIAVPRGYIGHLLYHARQAGIKIAIEDDRHTCESVGFDFSGKLRSYQGEALSNILTHDSCYVEAPTGSGKTVIALAAIAARKQPALVIVHSKELLRQWTERIGTFLGIPRQDVGVIGDGSKRIGKQITVGVVNSIYKIADQIWPYFGHVIIDECHKCPARTFTEAITAFPSRQLLGLSATPWRRDGLTKVIGFYLGPKVKVQVKDVEIIKNIEVITRRTGFMPSVDPSIQYSRMLSELCDDMDRNRLIVTDILGEASKGDGTCLVLSDRKNHVNILASMLTAKGINADVFTGDVGKRERESIVDRLNEGRVKVLVATGQLIGEGFDCPVLSTLFLVTPMKFNGRLIQYLGRILRPAEGKFKAKVYDYIDDLVGVLQVSAKARAKVYKQLQ